MHHTQQAKEDGVIDWSEKWPAASSIVFRCLTAVRRLSALSQATLGAIFTKFSKLQSNEQCVLVSMEEKHPCFTFSGLLQSLHFQKSQSPESSSFYLQSSHSYVFQMLKLITAVLGNIFKNTSTSKSTPAHLELI